MRKRLLSREQLERKYAECLKNDGTVNYFDFIVNSAQASSSPEATFKSWFTEMRIADRKDFILYAFAKSKHDDYGNRLVRWAVKYL